MYGVIIRNPEICEITRQFAETDREFTLGKQMEEIFIMTYQTSFNKLKEKFNNVDSSKLNDMAIQFTLTNEDCGGTFYAQARNGVLNVEPYDYKDNDAVVDVTREALTKILDGKLTIEKAIENGDLTVKGDLAKINAVTDAIKAPEKTETKKCAAKTEAEAEAPKAAAKKCAANKCAAKAEAVAEAPKAEAPKAAAKTEAVTETVKTAETEEKPKKRCCRKTAATKAPAAKAAKTTKKTK